MRLYILLALSVSTISFALTFNAEAERADFLDYPAGDERKQAFIRHLTPLIEDANQALLDDRHKLLQLRSKSKLNIREQRWLTHVSRRHGLDKFDHSDHHWTALFKRVDIIPLSLVLAQSAKESGWGSSRFARSGNNYFGQWCYRAGCGLVPSQRSQNAQHEVAVFDSIRHSIESYLYNLNTNPAYKQLRDIRRQLRTAGENISGYRLAPGLLPYSERGQAYIEEIQALILSNALEEHAG